MRLYVPVKLGHLCGGRRELSFYGKSADVALKKRAIGQRDLDERASTPRPGPTT